MVDDHLTFELSDYNLSCGYAMVFHTIIKSKIFTWMITINLILPIHHKQYSCYSLDQHFIYKRAKLSGFFSAYSMFGDRGETCTVM